MSNNDNTEKLIGLAQDLAESGQLEQALQEYLKVVAADDSDLRTWTRISELYVRLERKRDAVKSFKKIAQLLSAQKQIDKAIATYETVVRLAHQDADSHLALATLYRRQGHSQRAVRAYELAAQALTAQGRVRDALAVVQTIVDMSPEDVNRRVKLAEQYFQEKMFSEAAREFAAAAAASYLRKTGRRDDDSRQLTPSMGAPLAELAVTEIEAARLLAEADSFLRLGLIDKAIEHLEAALRHNPALRSLREPLVKLYVTQRQYKSAISQLWALLKPCPDPQEEIRYLRYILRLDGKDQEAKQRLGKITHPIEPAGINTQATEPNLSVGAIHGGLRVALEGQRPPTDLAATCVLPPSESQRYQERAVAPPSATTRPSSAEVEAAAEEMALSTGTLRAELAEVESWLQGGRFEEAQRRLFMLAVRYPHSKKVQAKLKALEHRQSAAHPAAVPGALPASKTTLEVEIEDIQEEEVAPESTPSARPAPPPPPHRGATSAASTAAEVAFRNGVSLRNRGQYEQAIAEFAKARGDVKQGARAVLMTGLCHRDQNRIWDAIASFKLGIHSPDASESDLTELFYQLGRSYELLSDAREAIVFYQMSRGHHGNFRDSAERIAILQQQSR